MRLLAAGTRMPDWVDAGFRDYAGRLHGDYRLELVEIPLGTRGRGDPARAVADEGARMLAAAGDRAHLVALQVGGRALDTAALARWLEDRARSGEPLAFCIGGPDGLAAEVDARARLRWSLSALTLPHGLARVMVAEALYRAVSVIRGLPYHRA
ncbi:MAG: 23S rRNA (pseudouridine(1915)-N(3))-methyltransferase RlmH [Steroidobacteraceae bacterium]